MSDAPREPGFYWVLDGGGWTIARWWADERAWEVLGFNDAYRDRDFDGIGPKIAPPTFRVIADSIGHEDGSHELIHYGPNGEITEHTIDGRPVTP